MDNVERFVIFAKEYCKQSENTIRQMESDVFEKVGNGLSEGGLYSFLDYANRQKHLYGYDIPDTLDACLQEFRKQNPCSKEELQERSLAENAAEISAAMPENIRNTGIGHLGLSTRTFHCLLRGGCSTFGDVADMIGNRKLWKIKGLGEKSAEEVRAAFARTVPAMVGERKENHGKNKECVN
ncbi:MAG: hypothetical protein LUE14_07935 [Clostridiales bacterium]|nr:hypothetical protein [Clostridiales bacterium]